MKNIQEAFRMFYKSLVISNNRDLAWERCYQYFGTDKPKVELGYLHLTAFLAVFGMYRGSSKLSKKDYFVNRGAVEIILNYNHKQLREFSFDFGNIEKIMKLKRKLEKYYGGNGISPTNTLISKVMLGTLGCVPAYDTSFIQGLRKVEKDKKIFHTFNKKSIAQLYEFYNYKEHKDDFEKVKEKIKSITQVEYPPMRLVDLYFWLIGNKKDEDKKKR